MSNLKKILITGGTGFIGSRLIEKLLLEKEYDVFFTGRKNPSGHLINQGAHFIQGNLEDAAFAQIVTEEMFAIVHCAGLAGTWGEYQDYYKANVLVTQYLLESAQKSGVHRFINISSPSIYFDFKDQYNLKEDYLPPKFSNFYAQTKYEAELFVRAYHSEKLQTVSLRPRSVIGRGDQNVLPRLVRLQETGSLVQVGKGNNSADITTVGNLLNAISLCLKAPKEAMGETYNITNGSPVKFWDFVELVLTKAKRPLKRKQLPYAPVMTLAMLNEWWGKLIKRKSEPTLLPISIGILSFSMTLDISKAREKLGYVPKLTTEEGIDEWLEGKK